MNCYAGRIGPQSIRAATRRATVTWLRQAVRTAVINKLAGGMGLIVGRKAFQRLPHRGGRGADPLHSGRLPEQEVTIALGAESVAAPLSAGGRRRKVAPGSAPGWWPGSEEEGRDEREHEQLRGQRSKAVRLFEEHPTEGGLPRADRARPSADKAATKVPTPGDGRRSAASLGWSASRDSTPKPWIQHRRSIWPCWRRTWAGRWPPPASPDGDGT